MCFLVNRTIVFPLDILDPSSLFFVWLKVLALADFGNPILGRLISVTGTNMDIGREWLHRSSQQAWVKITPKNCLRFHFLNPIEWFLGVDFGIYFLWAPSYCGLFLDSSPRVQHRCRLVWQEQLRKIVASKSHRLWVLQRSLLPCSLCRMQFWGKT